MRIRCALCLLVGLFVATQSQSEPQLSVIRLKLSNSGGQEFVCASPYTVSQCEQQVAMLRPVLHRYNAETLGKWTWVLIRSEDWKRILGELQLDVNSPAFSNLRMRQTFFEDVLLMPKAQRQMELVTIWHIPLNQLLEVAITHELGHALCQETDERKADKAGQQLRNGNINPCGFKQGIAQNVAQTFGRIE
jgi:hypothetical protein